MKVQVVNEIGATEIQIKSYLTLCKNAQKAMQNAYSEYSGFKVGAALLLKNGEVVQSCNVENASYGLTMCAERAAIAKAVSEGFKPGDLDAIAISSNGKDFSPCGACRQVIHEFGVDVVVIFEFEGNVVITTASKMLPYGYSEEKQS